jgi:transposase
VGKPTKECIKEFCNKVIDRYLSTDMLWSVDESHFSDNIGMPWPLTYYSKIGIKKRLKAKKKIRKRYTLLLGIANDGDYNYDIMEGSCNRKLFTEFVDTIPGDIICDNASIHKKVATDRITFVPPYSPEFNPVEMAFSVVKNEYRKQHQVKDVLDRILLSLKQLTAGKIKAMFRHVNNHIKNVDL